LYTLYRTPLGPGDDEAFDDEALGLIGGMSDGIDIGLCLFVSVCVSSKYL